MTLRPNGLASGVPPALYNALHPRVVARAAFPQPRWATGDHMAQLTLLYNDQPYETDCIGCAKRLAVAAGYRIFAGDLDHAICDECALKVDPTIASARDERNQPEC